ncbi:MAG: TPM domain-containing protein, partial [Candidatus Cloacimonetes bacterium]|nr:TPM domain-containing protein [Candidatus Cloacimonadota bacterium]
MRKIFALLIFLCLLPPLLSLKVPALQGRINDYANILSPLEEQRLDSYLAGQETKTTSQVVLLTIPSLENENLEEYSIRVAQTWRLG